MKRIVLALVLAPASVAGLAASAAPARAGDVEVGFFFGGTSGGRGGSRGFFGVDVRRAYEVGRARVHRQPRVFEGPYAPVVNPPVAYPPVAYPPVAPTYPAPGLACQEWIPAHEVCRHEVVHEPAVYDERCVPVYDTVEVPVYDEVCVPVFEDVCVPVFDERMVPVYDRVVDPRTGKAKKALVGQRLERVKVGERTEQRQVGERKERIVVGSRTERVKVGERKEQVLVRPATQRVVEVKDVVPGRFVTVVDHPVRPGTLPGEVMTRAQYEAALAAALATGRDTDASLGGAPRRGPPMPRSLPVAHR
ncbi:MAG: hypothetical protein JNM10_00350 [Planctomycetia bacterium]|nr:hypothetical protein [Planctomycetia bacterium]